MIGWPKMVVTSGEVRVVEHVARVGGRSAGCSSDRAIGRSILIRRPEMVVGSVEVRVTQVMAGRPGARVIGMRSGGQGQDDHRWRGSSMGGVSWRDARRPCW